MKATFKAIYSALTQRKNSFNSGATTAQTSAAVKNESDQLAKKQIDRCRRVLNYWLDFELFDVPQVPKFDQKKLMSFPIDDFLDTWQQTLPEQYRQQKMALKDESRLVVMFQCHWAGYLFEDSEQTPNERIPRTYLVAQALIPTWHEESQQFVWSRSEEDQDMTVNLAAIRTLIRRCPPKTSDNMSLSQWVEARFESIESMLEKHFLVEEGELLTTELLYQRLNKINRELSNEFWPDEFSRRLLLENAQPMETKFANQANDYKKDKPIVRKNDGGVTFRWRFSYYPDGNDQQQLGPFFVDDLECTIQRLESKGLEGLSRPLQNYLLGRSQQEELPEAVNNGAIYQKLTGQILYGRWPENPKYGLSLLQSVAVNVAMDARRNPVVAVNGPPGTGKTTLLKDVIAEHFVQRTLQLYNLSEKDDWTDSTEVADIVLQHSILVASSNNKAVENISKELPSASKVDGEFSKIGHFKSVAPEGDWGLFCAVLGNSSNRKTFKAQLKTLQNHLKYGKDIFGLNLLIAGLKKGQDGSEKAIETFLQGLVKNQRIELFIDDIDLCQASKKYEDVFNPWKSALQKLKKKEITTAVMLEKWNQMNDEHYQRASEAFEALKKQWFGKKLGDEHLEKKFKNSKKSFVDALNNISSINSDLKKREHEDVGLSTFDHLMCSEAFGCLENETLEEAEKRIQKSSPLGAEQINRARSDLFVAALAFNEAVIEKAATNLDDFWEDLESLLDGCLESNESVAYHQKLWAKLFLFFPVLSTSLSSVANQFRQMQKPGGFGVVMVDESGQAVNYHVTGLLQRCQQAILIGDPIQLEPVVTLPSSLDRSIAKDFLMLSETQDTHTWGDDYLVSQSSAQSVADNVGQFMSMIGKRKVGIPLLVHRRCNEPMFAIANQIAYDNKMVSASSPYEWDALKSGWIHVEEKPEQISKQGYANHTEAETAIQLVRYLTLNHPLMTKGGVYIITPFTEMKNELGYQWRKLSKDTVNHDWMVKAFGSAYKQEEAKEFAASNIGTVHTFQGKEASTVIICTAASITRKKSGGISWVNSKPNLLNVAVTRSKHHLFVVGNAKDWGNGTFSSELLDENMHFYNGLEQLKDQAANDYVSNSEMSGVYSAESASAPLSDFDFGGQMDSPNCFNQALKRQKKNMI